MRDLLAVGLGLADQRLEPRLQVLCGCGVKAVVYLPGVNQVPALAAAEIEAMSFFAVEREPGNGQRLALGTGLFHPVVAAPGCAPVQGSRATRGYVSS